MVCNLFGVQLLEFGNIVYVLVDFLSVKFGNGQ